jgi:phytoene/squalene synthetase
MTYLPSEIEQCTAMIKEGSSTFHKAFGFLDSPRKEAVFVIYAFCRIIDNAVDEPETSPFTIDALEDSFRNLESADGHFIWPALRWLYTTYPQLDTEPFLSLIKGMRQDLVHVPFTTMSELEDYSYLVAGTVGELLVPVLHPAPRTEIIHAGIQLGKAMQIVNILRDIGEDQRRNRRYIPAQLMAKHNYTEDDFQNGVVNENFRTLVEELAQLANMWLEQGLKIVDAYPQQSAFCMELAARGYMDIIDEIRAISYHVYTRRAIVSSLKKAALLTKLQLKYKNPFGKQATNQ